jgi:hypothetical protein
MDILFADMFDVDITQSLIQTALRTAYHRIRLTGLRFDRSAVTAGPSPVALLFSKVCTCTAAMEFSCMTGEPFNLLVRPLEGPSSRSAAVCSECSCPVGQPEMGPPPLRAC